MPPKFLYFDLGNVLLRFSHERQCRQMAEVAGVPAEAMRRVMYEGTMPTDLECGRITTEECYERLCAELDVRPDFERLFQASNDIFSVNTTIVPLIARLAAAGHRMGVLSNTSAGHWDYISDGRFAGLLPGPFEPVILSYKVGTMKPDVSIFHAAAKAAGVEPEEVFYTDDVQGHVEGARRAGFDAVQYVGTAELAAELRKRGVRFGY